MEQTTHGISINAQNMMPIIKKWLYSDRDIFIRELIANGCDAITKHKKLVAMGEAEYDEAPYAISVTVDLPRKALIFSDNGIGLTEEEACKYLGEVAFSGAADFAEKYQQTGDDAIIGHFGLGFYSAFMVAQKVQVDSLSCQSGAAPVRWTSDGVSEYSVEPSERSSRGTDITLFLEEDAIEFLQHDTLKSVITKYCGFLPYPIYLIDPAWDEEQKKQAEEARKQAHAHDHGEDHECTCEHDHGEDHECTCGHDHGEEQEEAPQPLNDVHPLWLKSAADCTEEEYKAFYRQVFHTWEEPLFWIHLNVDFPFRLKGILYFPRINEQIGIEGQIKLFNNQVFVADNIKEVIPEFLMLLRGVIDCPDLPLNVSRSMLQNDGTVRKMQTHITKKVADRLKALFENERETYEKDWKDISPFVRYGAVRDEHFYDQIKDVLLFEKLDGAFWTLEELQEHAKNNGGRAYYVTDPKAQSFYIDLFKAQGQDAVLLDTAVDEVFINFLEYKCPGLTFARIDADVAQSIKGEYVDMPDQPALEALMRKAAGNDKLTVQVEPLKSEELLSMLVMDENSRRFSDLAARYGNGEQVVPPDAKLILNGSSAVIRNLAAEQDAEKAALIASYVYDLALLGAGRMTEEQSRAFFAHASKVLSLIG